MTLSMNKSIKLFTSLIKRTTYPLTCSHSKEHLIRQGEAYFTSGRTKGHAFCLPCGREMIVASHEQLNALTRNLEAQVVGPIYITDPPNISHTKPLRRLPRTIFKCEVRRARKDQHCSGAKAHPIRRDQVFCFMVSHTGRELYLCPQCAREIVTAAHEQLNELMQALDQ